MVPDSLLGELLRSARRLELHAAPIADLVGKADAAIVLEASRLVATVLARHESKLDGAHALRLPGDGEVVIS